MASTLKKLPHQLPDYLRMSMSQDLDSFLPCLEILRSVLISEVPPAAQFEELVLHKFQKIARDFRGQCLVFNSDPYASSLSSPALIRLALQDMQDYGCEIPDFSAECGVLLAFLDLLIRRDERALRAVYAPWLQKIMTCKNDFQYVISDIFQDPTHWGHRSEHWTHRATD